MSLAICKKHGKQDYVATSPLLADALDRERPIPEAAALVLLRIDGMEEHGKISEHWFDREFLSAFLDGPVPDVVVLRDRSKREKSLNDRFKIRKIFLAAAHCCPACLYDAVEEKLPNPPDTVE